MKKKQLWLIAGVALIAAIVLLTVILGGGESPAAEVIVHDVEGTQASTEPQSKTALPALSLKEYREQDELVELVTTYGTISYPYAFSDLIEEEFIDEPERKAIEFFAALGGTRYPVYTVSFTGGGSIPLGTLRLGEADCEVTADINEASASLEGDDLVSFRAAQETFNDVWASMTANENFTPAQ